MKILKTLVFILAALAAIALLLPFFVPVKSYIPRLEQLATAKLGEPVSIGNLRFALLPWPSVTVQDIRIGPEREIRIGAVTVLPDVWTLASRVKVVRRIELDGITLDRALLGRLAAWSQERSGEKTFLVRHVQARQVALDLGGLRWAPLQADAFLDGTGLRSVEAGTHDGSLVVRLVPAGEEGFDLDIAGRNFTLPVQPALRFDELKGSGRLDTAGMTLPQLEGKLYGGTLKAALTSGWKEGFRMQGEARVADVDIEPVARLFGQSASLSGRLHGAGRFTLGGRPGTPLADSLRAGFRLEVRKGVLYNFDLATAVRALAKEGTRGGQTTFNELSGTVNLAGRNVQLRDLRVASGLLQANGDVDIAANRRLSGRLRVEMKGTASLVSVPLEVGGTLRDPILFPDRAALAGAAVGTGLMGPGLGTSVGAKAGEALGRLFR